VYSILILLKTKIVMLHPDIWFASVDGFFIQITLPITSVTYQGGRSEEVAKKVIEEVHRLSILHHDY